MSDNKTMIRTIDSAYALMGVAGDHENKQYLVKGEFKIGREQDNDIIINEGFVSRHHATIKLTTGILTVTDNDSSNGTYVNDKPVKTALLTLGDRVRFDIVEFLVCDAGADFKKTAITPPADNSAKAAIDRQAELERELEELQRIQKEREEQLRQEKARLVQLEEERIAKEKAEQERIAKEKAEQERIAKEKAEQERIAKEKAEKERIAKEKAEQERIAKEKAEQERIAQEKAEKERVAKEQAEQERIAQEKAEQERIAQEKAEQERIDKEAAEKERIALEKAEKERIAKEKAEQKRLAQEKAEQERIAKEKAEKDRIAQEKAQQEQLAKEKAEQERAAKKQAEQERIAQEKAEKERLAEEKAEQQRAAKEQAEQELQAQKKAASIELEKQKMEQARLLKERQQQQEIARELKEASDKAAQQQARKQQQQDAANKMADTVAEDEDKTVFAVPTPVAGNSEKTVFAPIAAQAADSKPEPEQEYQQDHTIRRDEIIQPADADEEKTLLAEPPAAADDDKTMVGAPAVSPLSAAESDKTIIGMPPNKDDEATLVMGQNTVSRIKLAAAQSSTEVELLGLTEPVIDRKFKLNKTLLSIGRSPFNDIIIKASSVSSQHAELEKVDGLWMVRDLGSSNGTYINDLMIEEAVLYSDDCLMIGEVELTFDPNGLMPPPEDREMDVIEIESAANTLLWLAIGGGAVLVAASLVMWLV
jgi:pSer/pThr/pTyr-binding forkhead associated (FHA) protein